jgi:hypothetical protein
MGNPSPSSDAPRASRFGTISLVLGALIWLAWCVYFILFGVLVEGGQGSSEEAGYALVLGGMTLLSILTVLLGIGGAVLGFLAIRKKDPKPAAAIAGLVLSLICLTPYCLFAIFVLIGGLQSFDPQDLLRQFTP